MKKVLLVLATYLIHYQAGGQTYTSYFTGDTADVSPIPKGGICLMGGSVENDAAMKWFLRQASGGDILVIRASGSNGYNTYMFTDLGETVNSVESIVTTSETAANEAYIVRRIKEAEGIWIAGGDQANYVNFWKSGPVKDAINFAVNQRKAVVGGTSAGMAVLGGAYFAALNGTVTSEDALANPYNSRVSLGLHDFLNVPILRGILTDTHFDNPDRKGRLVVFLARLLRDFNLKPRAIACEERVALTIDTAGMAQAFCSRTPKYAYFAQLGCAANQLPETLADNTPLTWNRGGEALKVMALLATAEGSPRFNLKKWRLETAGSGGTWQNWTAQNGVFQSATTTEPTCSPTTGAADTRFENVKIFPNPVGDVLQIKNAFVNSTIEVRDINGKLWLNKKMQTVDSQLSMLDLPPSVYVVILTTESGESANFRIVKM